MDVLPGPSKVPFFGWQEKGVKKSMEWVNKDLP